METHPAFDLNLTLIGFFRGSESPEVQHKVTQMQFYSFYLQDRHHHFNAVLRSRHLFQEYLVDAYAQIEQGRLRFIQCNQATFRVELYQGLADAAINGTDLNHVGSPSIFLLLLSAVPGT